MHAGAGYLAKVIRYVVSIKVSTSCTLEGASSALRMSNMLYVLSHAIKVMGGDGGS